MRRKANRRRGRYRWRVACTTWRTRLPSRAEGLSAQVEWGPEPEKDADKPLPAPTWSIVRAPDLYALMPGPQGLSGTVKVQTEGEDKPRPEQHRIDGTIAFCCLTDQLDVRGHPYSVNWTGTLTAPASGVYSMTLFTQSPIDLKIQQDGHAHR